MSRKKLGNNPVVKALTVTAGFVIGLIVIVFALLMVL